MFHYIPVSDISKYFGCQNNIKKSLLNRKTNFGHNPHVPLWTSILFPFSTVVIFSLRFINLIEAFISQPLCQVQRKWLSVACCSTRHIRLEEIAQKVLKNWSPSLAATVRSHRGCKQRKASIAFTTSPRLKCLQSLRRISKSAMGWATSTSWGSF